MEGVSLVRRRRGESYRIKGYKYKLRVLKTKKLLERKNKE